MNMSGLSNVRYNLLPSGGFGDAIHYTRQVVNFHFVESWNTMSFHMEGNMQTGHHVKM